MQGSDVAYSLINCRTKNFAIGLAVIMIYLLIGAYVRMPVRYALRDFFGAPYWLDHIFFMLLAELIVVTILARKFVGLKNVYLSRSTNNRLWLVASI